MREEIKAAAKSSSLSGLGVWLGDFVQFLGQFSFSCFLVSKWRKK